MWQWIVENKEWIGGVGTPIVVAIIGLFVRRNKNRSQEPTPAQIQNQTVNVNIGDSKPNGLSGISNMASPKATTNILFIDDKKFDNVSVLKKAGWINTKTINDIKSIDCPDVLWANVVFVDINGVGCSLFPKEQGLGVANWIKKQYPDKYVVLYSAQPQELHKTFSVVDAVLPKNADPYEYINILDNYINNRQS